MHFKALEDKLGYVFKNQKLLELALIHKSSNNISNNERLEFLGDTILNSIISEYLFEKFPNEKEGLLTRMRSHLVKGETLSKKANKIDTSFMNNLKNNVSQGKINEAKIICSQENTPVGRMLHKGISRLGRPLEDISTSIDNVATLEVSNMEKNLSILATISGAAPMIGFLGTVLGMMNTFHKMADGAKDSGVEIGDLSEGIMYAMTTTVAGLIVGIVAYLGYNLLVAKVDKVVHKMEDSSLEFMDLLNEPAQ